MNLSLPVEQWLTYTWRSTAIDARGGSSAVGAGRPLFPAHRAPGIRSDAGPHGRPPDCNTPFTPNPMYDTGEVRTAALPLLVDVKCYPFNGVLPSPVRPRVGSCAAGIQPCRHDQPSRLPGVFVGRRSRARSSSSTPTRRPSPERGIDRPPGELPVDNIVYYGALDLVTRVSRMHSIFYPAYNNSDRTPRRKTSPATPPTAIRTTLLR